MTHLVVTVDPYYRLIYVANKGNDSLSVFDIPSLNITKTLSVGRSPTAVAVDPYTGIVYIIGDGSLKMMNMNEDMIVIVDKINPDQKYPLIQRQKKYIRQILSMAL